MLVKKGRNRKLIQKAVKQGGGTKKIHPSPVSDLDTDAGLLFLHLTEAIEQNHSSGSICYEHMRNYRFYQYTNRQDSKNGNGINCRLVSFESNLECGCNIPPYLNLLLD